MPVRIVTADERLSVAHNKTSLAIFGPTGSGKTSLLKTLPPDQTVCLDLEAGMKSVQDWPGASIPIRSFVDFRDVAVLIGGPDPAADPNTWYSAQHHQHARGVYAGTGFEEFLRSKSIIFVDSITDLTRQVMVYARQQPEALSERTGKPDVRGAYGLLGREVIQALKHLQHAPGKTVIFVGVLEKVTDELNATTWQPQMEGLQGGPRIAWHRRSGDLAASVLARRRAVVTCSTREPANAGWSAAPAIRSACRRKDRSGRLDVTEAPDLGALLAKINATAFEPVRSALPNAWARSFTPPDYKSQQRRQTCTTSMMPSRSCRQSAS